MDRQNEKFSRLSDTIWKPGSDQIHHIQIFFPLAVIVILAVAILGMKSIFHNMMIFEAETDAIRVATALRDTKVQQLLQLRDNTKDVFYIPEAIIPEVDKEMRNFLIAFDVFKIKVFNLETEIIYSTDAAIMGQFNHDNSKLQKALNGLLTAKYAAKDKVWDLANEERTNVRIVETYVPMYDSSGKIIGSCEIYKDITEDMALAKSQYVRVGLILTVTVLGVFGALMLVIRRDGHVINSKTMELVDSNRELTQEMIKRNKVENALKLTNEELKEHGRLKNEFIMSVSHELRTPLTIFKNIIANILDGVMGRLKPKQHQSLELANKEVDRLSKIIDDFLEAVEFETGKVDIKRDRTDIRSIVDYAINLLKPLADNKNIHLETCIPQTQLFVHADHDKIVRVTNNILDNAIKFLPDCGGSITVRVKDMGDEVGVEVEDNGYGINTDKIDSVFDRFVQIDKQVGAGARGTGLGLSVCKETVELHGGRIWAENTDAGGVLFTFVLPKHIDEPVEITAGA